MSVAEKNYFTFVGGLNTEAGPLTYPPNTWQDGDNVVPDIDGSLNLRLGINYENGYALSSAADTPTEESTGAYATGEWNSVAGNGSRNFVVVQRYDTISFYDNTGDTISSTEKSFSLDLTTYKAATNPNTVGVSAISTASANGKLIITSPDIDPILVVYDEDTDTISASAITVEIRDLYGVDDTLTTSEKPTALSAEHNYNLLNQGWDSTKIAAYAALGGGYPSNAQSWTAAKDTNDDFSAALLNKQDFGSSPAPRGRFILPLFSRDRTTASGVASITTETENYRPSTVAFYAGRAWYAGIQSDTIGSWVAFSQVADTDDKYGKCYQDADPTSEVVSDLVDSDGGIIPIQDAGNIVKILPAYNSLLIFADNGLWQIAGGLDTGFGATSYQVRKLASVGCIGAKTVVEAEQAIYFWSTDGIWVVVPGGVDSVQVENITGTTIQSFFTDIPITGRTYASGRYYLEGKTLYWAYNSDTAQDGVTRRFKKDSLLCLDVRLKAFYTLSIESLASNSPYITDLLVTKHKQSQSTDFNVVDGSNNQAVVGVDTVIAQLTPTVLRNSEVRFLTQVSISSGTSFKVTFARFEDGLVIAAKFKDWYSEDSTGVSYTGFITPGYEMGNAQGGPKKMQGLYLTVYMRRTETGVDSNGDAINPSSCLMRALWDWTDSSASGKWSTQQEVYRHTRPWFPAVPSATYNDGYPVVVTKSKIRGRGRSVQLNFTSTAGKDMQLLGWSATYIGMKNV